MPNTKCADVLKLNNAYIWQICKSFQICAYSQICRSLNLFVKSVLKPWLYPFNIPAVDERVIKFQTWCTREFWETLHPSPDFVKSWWKFSISRLIHQQHMTASIIYCPLCHSGGSGDLFVYLGFDSSIFVFFFRRDGMLLYLVVGCYFERSLVRKSEMFCHQFHLRQWVFPWWVGIKGGGKVDGRVDGTTHTH